MKKCPKCGGNHEKDHKHFTTKSRLSDSGFPTNDPKYLEAHKKANIAEKHMFGKKAFRELDSIDRHLGKHELSGKNLKSGKIEVSKKVPKRDREEVAYHEKVENRELRKKK